MMKTKTSVHSRREANRQRLKSEASAQWAAASVQLGAQMILWLTFFGYDRAAQTVWQAALLWVVPFFLLWFLWKKGTGVFLKNAGRYALLGLLPCLMMDAAFLLFALGGYMGQLIPQYPGWMSVWVVSGFAVLTAFLSKPRGVSYGIDGLKWGILLLFVLSTVFLRQSSRADRLWPILGKGLKNTAMTALLGVGSLWGIALFFLFPGEEKADGKTVLWGLIPWALGVIWALWYGFVRPWNPGDVLPVAEKMMGFARHASSVTLYEMAGVMWMVLLPLSLTGALTAGERIVTGVFEKCPRLVPLAAVLLPGFLGMLLIPGKMIGILEKALPLRAALSFGTAVFLCVLARRQK